MNVNNDISAYHGCTQCWKKSESSLGTYSTWSGQRSVWSECLFGRESLQTCDSSLFGQWRRIFRAEFQFGWKSWSSVFMHIHRIKTCATCKWPFYDIIADVDCRKSSINLQYICIRMEKKLKFFKSAVSCKKGWRWLQVFLNLSCNSMVDFACNQ